MSKKLSGIFVETLKEKIREEKSHEKKKRILLQDSLNIILEMLSLDSNLEIRSIRDFETSEIASFIDVYSPEDLLNSIGSILNSSGIEYSFRILDDYKFVLIIDLGKRVISSGSARNLFSLQVISKRLKTFKVKISPCEGKFFYSLFEKNYHEIKYWYYKDSEISVCSIPLGKIPRDKRSILEDHEHGFTVTLDFDDLGMLNNFNLSLKRGRKKS